MTAINFNSIYTTYYRRAFLFTLSYVHNDLVAEDIVSEAIIYLWELSKKQEIPSIEAELRSKVKTLLAGMPEKTRIAFISDRLDGKSHKEIAEELGISVKGVEYHISKAVKLLRDNLKEYAPFLIFFI